MANDAKRILEKQLGCLGWYSGSKPGTEEFVVVTMWESQDSLRKFTGPRWQEARIDAAEAPFLDGNPTVEHYDSL